MLILALAAALAAPADKPFTAELWESIRPVYARTLEHPYLRGLADGTLARQRFHFYLVQDSHYLRGVAQALSVLAAKAPRDQWAITLNQHAADALQMERQLHESILAKSGVKADAPVAPTNYAYVNHLLGAAYRLSFGEGLAAVLPCYWIYQEVGMQLKKRGSRDPDYQRWIDQYADPAYAKTVAQVIDMMNAEAPGMGRRERENARSLFERSARYEYMFWDMAWREESWLP